MKQIIIATHNLGKLEEFKVLMKDVNVELKCLADFPKIEEPEETGKSFAANARLKAQYYAKKLGENCLADDSGLEVMSLKGAPGVRSARYAGEECTPEDNNELLLKNMKFYTRRNCRFVCALAIANSSGKILAETNGVCEGLLLHEPLGTNGFGYDPLFWSKELHMGLGEASMEEKNQVSHRAKAVGKLCSMWSTIK